MVKFAMNQFEMDYHNWTKHHKEIAIFIKREYEDGRVLDCGNKDLLELGEKHKDELVTKTVQLFHRKTGGRSTATEYYLLLENQDYINSDDIPYYSVGSMNTKLTMKIRFKFMLEEHVLFLEYEHLTGGSYAASFHTLVSDSSFIEDVIDTLAEKDALEENGIRRLEDNDEDIYQVLVTTNGIPDTFDIEKREIVNALVGMEIYQFDMQILELKEVAEEVKSSE